MEKVVFNFLKKQCDPAKPVLLGLSGGSDSLSLFQLLLSYQKICPFKFGVAHVDHGWRKESSEEALLLEKRVVSEGIPFHLARLDPSRLKGNLEAACREERLKFFGQLCRDYHYQAVLLAHHADDQAETVLKRVLEGSGLTNLSGLREITQFEGLSLWRPLLKVTKKEIVRWLDEQGLQGLEDSTNLDPTYLRSRMRSSIIPGLSRDFGKEVSKTLATLGEEAAELKEYFNDILAPYLARIEKGKRGLFLDLSGKIPQYPVETHHVVRKFCEIGGISLSRTQLYTAVQLLMAKAADRKVQTGAKTLFIDRQRLFLPNENGAIVEKTFLPLIIGNFIYGKWAVEVETLDCLSEGKRGGWKEVWEGSCEVCLPKGDYLLGPADSSVGKWWTNHKVPAFLRDSVPVIWEQGQIHHEFLTGRTKGKVKMAIEWLKIKLNYRFHYNS